MLWLVILTLLTNNSLKLKVETLYWHAAVAKVNINYTKRCHDVFTFNFEQIQQINQIFWLLTLNMYLSVGHMIKSTKKLKCSLKNEVVSLNHVHKTSLSQHGLNNP